MKNQIVLSTASVAAAIQAITLADSQKISLKPHSSGAYETLAAGSLTSAHNQQLIQMAEHSIRTAIIVDPAVLASGYAELADASGPSADLIRYLAQSFTTEQNVSNLFANGPVPDLTFPGQNDPQPDDPTQVVTNEEIIAVIFAEYNLEPPENVAPEEMFDYLQFHAQLNPGSAIAAVYDSYCEIYNIDPETGEPLDQTVIVETLPSEARVITGSFFDSDSTITGGFGCYNNCHNACHGSRGWR